MAGRVEPRVLIIGAGPVGLFLAYRLGKASINVDLIEQLDELSDAPRAGGYYGATCFALKDAGLLHLLAERGYVDTSLGWRTPVVEHADGVTDWGELVAHLPFENGTEEHPELGMLLLPQAKFCKLLLEQALKTGRVNVMFGSQLVGIHQEETSVTATIRDANTGMERRMLGSFLVGADGGKSTTRKLLNISLPGHTWPERLIATDVVIPNHRLPKVQAHYVIDPINFAVIIPLAKPREGEPSLWRYTVAIDPSDNRLDEEILSEEHIEKLYEKLMVGPRPLQYKIERKAIYRIHQRLATTMSKGRCALAGDAAHLNNPFGAMGLTSGILDADALADTLLLILNEQQPLSLLQTYSDERRKVFQTFIDPTSTYNKLRLQCTPEVAEYDWFIRSFKRPTQPAMDEFFAPFVTTWRTNMRQFANELHVNGNYAQQQRLEG